MAKQLKILVADDTEPNLILIKGSRTFRAEFGGFSNFPLSYAA